MAAVTRDSLWKTAEGRVLPIRDMTNSHLLNCIRCIRDMSPIGTQVNVGPPERRREWLNAMANEAYARGLELDPLTENEPVHE